MESCFVLSIESDGIGKGTVTCSVEGVLGDGQRMMLRPPTETAIGQLVTALRISEALEAGMIEAIDRLKGSYRLQIDVDEYGATRFVEVSKRSLSMQ